MIKNYENPEELLFYIINIREELKKKYNIIYTDDDKREVTIYSEELEKENNENYITIIFYFKKVNSNKSFIFHYDSKSYIINNNNDQNFLYDDKLKDYSIIEISNYEKFKFYKKFVDKYSTSNLKEILYRDSYNICQKSPINFLFFLQILEYYKENEEKTNKLFSNFFLSSKLDNIDINELNNKKYIELIELFIKNENINFKGNNEEKGKLNVMILLYFSLSFEDKFINFLKSNENNKEQIYNVLNKIEVIEELFIEKKLGTIIQESNDVNEVNDLLNNCKYFPNFIFLLTFYIKNSNKLKLNEKIFSKQYEISIDDNLKLMLERYKEIQNVDSSININKKIYEKYVNLYKSKLNWKPLLLLINEIDNKEELYKIINEIINEIFIKEEFNNIKICKFIQENLIPKIYILKGQINLILEKNFNLNDLSNEVIVEFKNCKLEILYGDEKYLEQQEKLINTTNNFKTLSDTLKLFTFENIDKNRFDMLNNYIIEEIGKKF